MLGSRRVRRAATRAGIALAAVGLVVGVGVASAGAAGTSRWFTDSDPVNLGVSANQPQEYGNSATLAARFGSSAYDANVATGGNSVIVHQATADTPHYQVTARAHIGDWGPNPFVEDVYWDPSWPLAPADADNPDGWVVSISPDGSYDSECWKARIVNGKLSCEWGFQGNPSGGSTEGTGAPTGSGLSRLSGVITQEDWDNGIDHALAFGTPDNYSGKFVYPAVKTDGDGSGPMKEGDYIWMSTSGSCAAPGGLTTAQQLVYKALQEYGAFNVDNAETFGFSSEASATPPGGTGGGWLSMRALPWASCLHVGTVTTA